MFFLKILVAINILTSNDVQLSIDTLLNVKAVIKCCSTDVSEVFTFFDFAENKGFDSLYNFEHFHVLTHDVNGVIPLSFDIVEDLIKIGEKNGIILQKFKMIFGGGATDAAESARIGIPSTTIIAMPTNIIREGMVYHTRNDTVENIDPSVVEGCLKITWDYLIQIDK